MIKFFHSEYREVIFYFKSLMLSIFSHLSQSLGNFNTADFEIMIQPKICFLTYDILKIISFSKTGLIQEESLITENISPKSGSIDGLQQ